MDIMKTIKAIIILGIDGKRIISRYYDEKLNTQQFDRQIHNKTKNHKKRDDIFVIDSSLILHRHVTDLHLYVAGSRSENPMILEKVLNCLVEVVSTILNRNVEQQSLMDNLDKIILAFDEMSDEGIILEVDPDKVLQRVGMDGEAGDQSMARVIQSAAEHIKFPWIRS